MTIKAVLITNQIKIINRKKFAKIVLNKSFKIFIVHFAFLSPKLIYPAYKAQMISFCMRKIIILI